MGQISYFEFSKTKSSDAEWCKNTLPKIEALLERALKEMDSLYSITVRPDDVSGAEMYDTAVRFKNETRAELQKIAKGET